MKKNYLSIDDLLKELFDESECSLLTIINSNNENIDIKLKKILESEKDV